MWFFHACFHENVVRIRDNERTESWDCNVPHLLVVGCVAAYLSGVAQPVGGRVCYRLVSELLVETPGQYGSGLLVRVSWLRSNYDLEVENLRRDGIAESTQELERQRSFVRDRRIMTIPFRIRERSPLWDQERSGIVGSEGR
jgi:hypothetical protein